MATQYTCVCKTRYIIEIFFHIWWFSPLLRKLVKIKIKKHLLAETFSSTSLSRGLCSFDSLKDANLKECKKKEKWQKHCQMSIKVKVVAVEVEAPPPSSSNCCLSIKSGTLASFISVTYDQILIHVGTSLDYNW